MKNRRSTKAVKNKLLPTGAPYAFYDPKQSEVKEPRQGSFTAELIEGTYQRGVSDGAIKIERVWADVTTAELQQWIDLFESEVLKRALAGENEAIAMFASKIANLVDWLERLTQRQREKVERVAAKSVFWPVNVTQRDPDFTWATSYVRDLKVGSKSFLPPKIGSRIDLHKPFTRLAVRLWLQLLKNRDELPGLLKAAGSESARKLKTKWNSRCLLLPTVEELRAPTVIAQHAPTLWELGEALLLEAWASDRRQAAFGSVLPEYERRRSRRKTRTTYTEAEMRDEIIDNGLKNAFLSLLGQRGMRKRPRLMFPRRKL
jgi:hypothetical protein